MTMHQSATASYWMPWLIEGNFFQFFGQDTTDRLNIKPCIASLPMEVNEAIVVFDFHLKERDGEVFLINEQM